MKKNFLIPVAMMAAFLVSGISCFAGVLEVGGRYSNGVSLMEVTEASDCYEDEFYDSEYNQFAAEYGLLQFGGSFGAQAQTLSCTQRREIEGILELTSVSFAGLGIVAVCTGIGSPAMLAFESSAAVVSLAKAVISRIPCEDNETAQMVKLMVRQQVCEILQSQAIACEPHRVDVNE